MAVRNLNGVNDEVHCAVASLAGEQGFGTIAAIFKRNGTGAYGHFIGGRVTSGTNQWVLGFNAGDAIEWWINRGAGGQVITSTTTWYLLVARKTSGDTTPRYSLYNFTTATWSHQAASQSIANSPTALASGDTINMSWDGAERFNGRLAVRAKDNAVLWTLDAAGDTAIEAAGLEDSLQKWIDAGFDSVWPFNQAATTTPVEDIVGTADQVQLDNTTVVTGDDPPGFSFALDIEGSGSAVAPAAMVSGTGTLTSPGHYSGYLSGYTPDTNDVTGDGSAVAPATVVSGAGTVLVAGSGAATAPAATSSGTGAVLVAGSGDLTAPAAVVSGAGTAPITGSGSAVAPAATVSGEGTVAWADITGEGSATAPAAVVSGDGDVLVTGTGSLTSPAASAAGTSGVLVQGSGEITAPVAIAAGSGVSLVAGAGDAAAPAAALSGAGTVLVQGAGSAVAPAAVASGTGGSTDAPITGNGGMVAPAAQVAGSGSVTVDGSGSLTAPVADADGTAAVPISGSGEVIAPTALISGDGFAVVFGSGSVIAAVVVVTGSGAVLVHGEGSLVAPAATVSGSELPPPEIPEVLTLTPVIVGQNGMVTTPIYHVLIPLED